jgi:hypothetical protein
MERQVYDKRSFRRLPRDECVIELLLGVAAGPCRGLVHRHHVNPEDADSRTVAVCNGHHQRLHSVLRTLDASPQWKTCNHRHRYPEGKEACERRLNGVDRAA